MLASTDKVKDESTWISLSLYSRAEFLNLLINDIQGQMILWYRESSWTLLGNLAASMEMPTH